MPLGRPATHARFAVAVGAVVSVAALVGLVGHASLVTSPPADASAMAANPVSAPHLYHHPTERHAAAPKSVGVADGEMPDGVTVLDNTYPGVTKLDPALLRALRAAAKDAGGDNIRFVVNSGWRSPRYQEQLLDQAIATYGSRAKAARWVASPRTSAHVSGDAVDIGPSDADSWLSERGVGYGLCQIYRNEPWHYELRPEAVQLGCPTPYADPAHDPRTQ